MTIWLWKGFHSPELAALIANAWQQEELLILCPPLLRRFEFVKALPRGKLKLCGEWSEAGAAALSATAPPAGDGYPERPVLGVFTSGTATGEPRLALYSKRNVEAALGAIERLFDRRRIEAVFSYPQPFHTFGLTLGYVWSMLNGWRLLSGEGPYREFFHERWLSATSERLMTLGAPTHFRDLLRYVSERGAKPRPSYSCIAGGAPVSRELWRAVRDRLNIEAPSIGYGCTEAAPGLAHLPPGVEPLADAEIGFLLNGIEVDLREGEGLEFRGPSLCLAMIEGERVELPKRVRINDDLARGEGGRLIYRGRTDLVVNRGGFKLSLEGLEREIAARLGCEVICVAVPDERLGEDVGILVRAPVIDLDALGRAVKSAFGLRLDPRRCVAVDRFPVNASAKVCRKASVALVHERSQDEVTGTP